MRSTPSRFERKRNKKKRKTEQETKACSWQDVKVFTPETQVKSQNKKMNKDSQLAMSPSNARAIKRPPAVVPQYVISVYVQQLLSSQRSLGSSNNRIKACPEHYYYGVR